MTTKKTFPKLAKVSMTALLSLIVLSSKQRSSHFARAFVPLALQHNNVLNNRSSSTTTTSSNTWVNKNNLLNQSLLIRQMSTEASTSLTEEQKIELETKIKNKGDEIRSLKDSGADKETVAPLVAELLALKAELDPSSVVASTKKEKSKKKKGDVNNSNSENKSSSNDETSDFITPRSENYSKWYNDIIRVTDLAETSPVRGCMVIKPWGMSLWENVRNDLDARIKAHGAENAYFPLLIPKSFLSKEAEHVDGFAKECAVVTHHRLTADPSGEKGLIADPEAELEDPLIIRPTSETMIWNMVKKWIISHR